MKDILLRGTTENKHFRIALLFHKNVAENARILHDASPLVSVCLSRFVGASLLLSTNLKDDQQYSLSINSTGPVKGIACDVTNKAEIRVYPKNPHAHNAPTDDVLDIKKGIGSGTLSVTKWRKDQKEPYKSIIDLNYGTIAEDFSYYLTSSEQIPSALMIGEYINKDATISHAGALLIQAMPDAEDNEIGFLETTLHLRPSLSEMIMEEFTPEMIFDNVLGIMGYDIVSQTTPMLKCSCSREKAERTLISLGSSELNSIISQKEALPLLCEYCKKEYNFTTEDLIKLVNDI